MRKVDIISILADHPDLRRGTRLIGRKLHPLFDYLSHPKTMEKAAKSMKKKSGMRARPSGEFSQN